MAAPAVPATVRHATATAIAPTQRRALVITAGTQSGSARGRRSCVSPFSVDAERRPAGHCWGRPRPLGGQVSTDTESAASANEALGPVDAVVIGFPPDAPMTGDAIPLLMDLIDRGTIRVLDVMFVTKEEDGTFAGFNATDLTTESVGDLTVFEGASSGMLRDEDVARAADVIEPGTSAVLLVYENRWSVPFA